MSDESLAEPIAFTKDNDELRLLGRTLFRGSMHDLLGEIKFLLDENRRHLVITPNVDQVLNLKEQRAYRRAFDEASLRPLDGAPLAWLGGRILGKPVERNTGADLLVELCADSRFSDRTVALVGGTPEASTNAANILSSTGVCRVIAVPTPFADIDDAAYESVVNELTTLNPDVVFIGMGSPRQEEWYLYWKKRLPSAVYIGSGAAYAFVAGTLSRAPQWMQKSGLEWAHRLLSEPRRLAHRYLVKGPQFVRVIRDSFRVHRQRSVPDLEILTSAMAPWGAEHSLFLILEEIRRMSPQRIRVTCQSTEIVDHFSRIDGVEVNLVEPHRNRFIAGLRLLLSSQARTLIIFSLDLLPLVPLGRIRGRRMVVDLHDYPQQRHVRMIVRSFTRMAHRTIAISRFCAQLTTSRNTVIVRRPFAQEFRSIRTEPVTPLRVGLIGRLDPDKGHRLALAAAQYADSQIHLTFVGAPSPGHEAYAEELLRDAAALGERFHYAGTVSPSRVFDGVDVLLVANDREAAGRTVVEAMIAGIPVVVPDSGGAMEFISEGSTGWLYHAGEPMALAYALEEVLNASSSARIKRLTAAQVSAAQLAPAKVAAEYVSVL